MHAQSARQFLLQVAGSALYRRWKAPARTPLLASLGLTAYATSAILDLAGLGMVAIVANSSIVL